MDDFSVFEDSDEGCDALKLGSHFLFFIFE